MPDDDRSKLEPPQLFGRRRRRAREADDAGFEGLFADSGVDAEPDPVTEPDATAVLPAQPDEPDEPAEPQEPRRSRLGRRTTRSGAVDVVDIPVTPDAPVTPDEQESRPRRVPRDRTVPLLPGRPAAIVTGLVVGLALLGFTWVGFRACEAARGTTSCGTAPGMAALVVIFVLAVTVGGLLLSRFAIPDPGATSFLGTGLTAVVYLLAVDYLDNWTVLVVVPVVTALTFLLSWIVTTTFVEVD